MFFREKHGALKRLVLMILGAANKDQEAFTQPKIHMGSKPAN